jgi:hypothetical protein
VRSGRTTAEILKLNSEAVVSEDLSNILEAIKEDYRKEGQNPSDKKGINTWKYFLKSIANNKTTISSKDIKKENKGYTPKESDRYVKYK